MKSNSRSHQRRLGMHQSNHRNHLNLSQLLIHGQLRPLKTIWLHHVVAGTKILQLIIRKKSQNLQQMLGMLRHLLPQPMLGMLKHLQLMQMRGIAKHLQLQPQHKEAGVMMLLQHGAAI